MALSSSRLLTAAISGVFVYGMIAAMLGVLVPSFKTMTEEQIGGIFSIQAFGLMIASISVGPLVDNLGKKLGLLLALAIIAASLFYLPSTSDSYSAARATVFMLGFGGGILVTAANALGSEIGEGSRASALNFMNLFFGVGSMFTPIVSSTFLDNDPIKLCYLAAVLTAVAWVINMVTTMPGPKKEGGFQMSEAGALVSRPELWLLAVMLFVYVACEVGVFNWLVKYLMSVNVAESMAKSVVGWGFAGGLVIGRLVISGLLTRMNLKPIDVTLYAAVAMAVTTFAMLQVNEPTLVGAVVFLAGIAMAPVFPTTLAIVGDAFPRGTATAMGIVITAGWTGLAVSSAIIGSVAKESGLKTALMVLPCAAVIMAIANLALRPILAKKPNASAARA